jgi:hypothetical protein
MAFLEQFSAGEQSLLVTLPYRAGLWISMSDTTGGAMADAQERATLARIIAASARGNFNSPFVHEVMKSCFERRAEWPQWRDNIDRIPRECQQVVGALEGRLNGRDVLAYRQEIMSIANNVARAFREQAPGGEGGAFGHRARGMLDALIGLIRREKFDKVDLLNISVKEDVALGTLAEALRMPSV